LPSLKELNGLKVVTTDAFTIGEVDGIEFDIAKATISHLRVDLTKEAADELRFKKPFMGSVIICIPLNFIQAYGHVINLNVPLTQIKTLRECQ
jgi:sporulation protein YlmC with PRC-barrel domain